MEKRKHIYQMVLAYLDINMQNNENRTISIPMHKTQVPTEELIRKMWYIYTMEYYTAEKNNDILKFAGK